MRSNVPSDFNSYWLTCSICGRRYHASEGSCCSPLDDDEECCRTCSAYDDGAQRCDHHDESHAPEDHACEIWPGEEA